MTQSHLYEARFRVGTVLCENLLDACCSLGILGHHVQVAASACAGKLVARAEVVDEAGDGAH